MQRCAVEEDRVGEGPAHVNSEQHRLKLIGLDASGSAPLLVADLTAGGKDEVDAVQLVVYAGKVDA